MGLRNRKGAHVLPQDIGLQDGYGLLILPGAFVFKSTTQFKHGVDVQFSKSRISWKLEENLYNCNFNIGFISRSFSGQVLKMGMYPCYGNGFMRTIHPTRIVTYIPGDCESLARKPIRVFKLQSFLGIPATPHMSWWLVLMILQLQPTYGRLTQLQTYFCVLEINRNF
jgi:hypothetical protein